MPNINFEGNSIECSEGENLRRVLLDAKQKLYNGPMGIIHCRGFGTCGTCAVQIEGNVSEPTAVEKWRLSFPPHSDGIEKGLRLACQCRIKGDLVVKKLDGWWGQKS